MGFLLELWGLKNFFSPDLYREIIPFVVGDIRTPAFARELRQKLPGRDLFLRMIENAWSRKNGFGNIPEPEEFDTEHPHWIYNIPEEGLNFQSINCLSCGNYVWCNTMGEVGIDQRSICFCG